MYISFQDVKEISYIGQIGGGFQGKKKMQFINHYPKPVRIKIHIQYTYTGGAYHNKSFSRGKPTGTQVQNQSAIQKQLMLAVHFLILHSQK